jgi:hypothetical protein
MSIFAIIYFFLYFVIGWCLIASAVRYAIKPLIPPLRLSTEARLEQLDQIRDNNLITPEEYAAKRQDILKDL